MKALTALKKCAAFALCGAVIVAVIFFPHGKGTVVADQKRVVRVWNVDTFEGGKGSRTAFLSRAAKLTEKRRAGVYYLVSSYTPEGARDALLKGETPDILSFGIGLELSAEKSLPLSVSFSGGETEEGCLAVPWCRGEYFLYSLLENFEEEGNTAVSCGGSNLPQVSAALARIKGEEKDSLSAYVSFLNGEYRYLLGTQRDKCRFDSRGVQVYAKELPDYNDLYQYISVLSAEKREDCSALVQTLLSEEMQGSLSDIGMYPVNGGGAQYTVSVFSSPDFLENLRAEARSGTDAKNILKFLKTV